MPNRTRPLLTALLIALLATQLLVQAAAAQPLPGRVLRVIDGDSLVLDVRGSHYQIELAGIDAPELNQPWGDSARIRLQQTLGGAFVVVDTQPGDGHGVTGRIVFKQADISLQMLNDGLAWSLWRVDGVEPGTLTREPLHPYQQAENDARTAKRGLWADDEPVPPWQWRRPGAAGVSY